MDASALLRAGVPLSLLLDLGPPAGPDSAEILRVEGVLADLAVERKVIGELTAWEARRSAAETA
jgi:hypothetical protein